MGEKKSTTEPAQHAPIYKRMNARGTLLVIGIACSTFLMCCDLFESRNDEGPVLFTSSKSGTSQLYSMNIDGSNARQLTDDPAFSISWARWSPTGKDILVGSRQSEGHWVQSHFYLIDAQGANRRPLFAENSIGYLGGGTWPEWSPDGSKITYRLHFGDTGYYGVGLIDVDRGTNTVIWEHLRPAFRTVWDWSNDGSKLLGKTNFTVYDSTGTASSRDYLTIWNIDGDSLSAYSLRDGAVGVAKWSYDEELIAFSTSQYKDRDNFLGVLRLSSGELTELPHDDFYVTLPVAWSRDGTKILASAYPKPGDDQRIVLIDVATGSYRDITPFDDFPTRVQSWNQSR